MLTRPALAPEVDVKGEEAQEVEGGTKAAEVVDARMGGGVLGSRTLNNELFPQQAAGHHVGFATLRR